MDEIVEHGVQQSGVSQREVPPFHRVAFEELVSLIMVSSEYDRNGDSVSVSQSTSSRWDTEERADIMRRLTPATLELDDLTVFFGQLVEKIQSNSPIDDFAKDNSVNAAVKIMNMLYRNSLVDLEDDDERLMIEAVCAGVYVMFHVARQVPDEYLDQFDKALKETQPINTILGRLEQELLSFERSELYVNQNDTPFGQLDN